MIGVGFRNLCHSPVPQLPLSYPHPCPRDRDRTLLAHYIFLHRVCISTIFLGVPMIPPQRTLGSFASRFPNNKSPNDMMKYVKSLLIISLRQSVYTRLPSIRKTCPCSVYPLKPHFYIAKLGYAGVYLFFLYLLQNIDCGYSLKPPRRGGSNVYLQSMFGAKIRKIFLKIQ